MEHCAPRVRGGFLPARGFSSPADTMVSHGALQFPSELSEEMESCSTGEGLNPTTLSLFHGLLELQTNRLFFKFNWRQNLSSQVCHLFAEPREAPQLHLLILQRTQMKSQMKEMPGVKCMGKGARLPPSMSPRCAATWGFAWGPRLKGMTGH